MGGPAKEDSYYVAGYRYYMGAHLVPCYGPVDKVSRMLIGEREAWAGSITESTEGEYINAQNLFGGDDREGGFQGHIDFAFGEATQQPNAYLQDKLETTDVPAFRGVLSIIFNRCQFSANSPYFKPVWLEVSRVFRGWNPSDAEVIGHANPAHIIYETLVNTDWGMQYPVSSIDGASFASAASLFKSEGLGLALQWKTDQSIEDFLGNILVMCGAVLSVDSTTGAFKLKAIRADYTPATLPLYDESNILSMEDFQRPIWSETINEVTVSFVDRSTHKVDQVTVQNLAAIEAQGGIINVHKEFGGIPTPELASRVAMRELNITSTPLSTMRLKVNRKAWDLEIGEVIRVSWVKLGLVEVVYRALAIDMGSFEKGDIVITLAEDYFGMPSSTYVTPEPNGWSPPDYSPVTVTETSVVELPYYLVLLGGGSELIAGASTGYGYVGNFAQKPNGLQMNYEVHYAPTSGGTYEHIRNGSFSPRGELSGAVTELETVFELQNHDDFTPQNPGSLAFIDTEICEVISWDAATNQLTVVRGVLDTHVATHALAAEIWLFDARTGFDSTERLDGETTWYKLLSKTGIGVDDIANPTSDSVTLDNRATRPYPPANIKIKDAYFPAAIAFAGDIDITWAHRDRLQQTAGFNGWTEGNIGPEAGTTYTLVMKSGVTTLRTVTGITGTSYTYTNAFEIADAGILQSELTVELWSVRSTIDSFQVFSHTFSRNTADGLDLDTSPSSSDDLDLTEVII